MVVKASLTCSPRHCKSRQYRAASYFSVFVVIFTLYYIFISRSIPLLPRNVDTAKCWYGRLIFSYRGIDMFTAQHCLEGDRKDVILKQTLICDTCWILCRKTRFFTELCPYQNIFVYLFLFRFVGPKIWNSMPTELKQEFSLKTFRESIKFWKPLHCSCRLCKSFVNGVEFLQVYS